MVKKIIIFLLIFSSASFAGQRYISCIPSLTEILYGLGLEEQVVGVTSYCNFPPEAQKKEKVGGVTMNLEKIISLKPDLLFLLEDAQKRDIEKLRKFHLPLFVINPRSVPEVAESIKKIGAVTGREEAAECLLKIMRERIAEVSQKVKDKPKKKVFIVVGYRPLVTVGRENFINDIINLAGGENISAISKSPYPQFSFEELIKNDPEALIILEGLIPWEELKSDPRWKSLSAVRKNMVLFIDPDMISRPTPRLVGAIERIALFLHDE